MAVWYLMLLHHSQTQFSVKKIHVKSGILCFYIILKQVGGGNSLFVRLVSYAFTSFSNISREEGMMFTVWYLMLLHHSQTNKLYDFRFCLVWYLMLLHHSQTLASNSTLSKSLVSYAFTSFSNLLIKRYCFSHVWYLMLLHHSQTRGRGFFIVKSSGILCFYIILKRATRSIFPDSTSGILCFYIILKRCIRKQID